MKDSIVANRRPELELILQEITRTFSGVEPALPSVSSNSSCHFLTLDASEDGWNCIVLPHSHTIHPSKEKKE